MNGIIIFSVCIFFTMGLAGYFTHKSRIWNFVDIIYYPLGAIGVVFLFMLQHNDRVLLTFKEQENLLKNDIQEIIDKKPHVSSSIISKNSLSSRRKYFGIVKKWAEACGGYSFTNEKCNVAVKLDKILSKYSYLFNKPFNTDAEKNQVLMNICNSSFQIFDELDDDSILSSFILDLLKKHYKSSVSNRYAIYTYDNQQSYINSFSEEALEEYKKILKHLPSSYHKMMSEIYVAEIELSVYIFNGLGVCMEVPEEIRNGKLVEWSNNLNEIQSKMTYIEKEISRVSEISTEPTELKYINLLIWPYILIFGLGLKFGKGVGPLREYFKSSSK